MSLARTLLSSLLLSLAATAAIGSLSTCETSDDCGDAKDHLCSKVQSMNCMTSFMENAVERIGKACGEAESARFAAAAAEYCRTAAEFSVVTCAGK